MYAEILVMSQIFRFVLEPLPMEPIVPTVEIVTEEIISQARTNFFDVNLALKIANCESNFTHDAKNPNSSAKGVYQFIDGTWKWIGAEGHQYDYKENIKQFFKWYPRFPQWWSECNKKI